MKGQYTSFKADEPPSSTMKHAEKKPVASPAPLNMQAVQVHVHPPKIHQTPREAAAAWVGVALMFLVFCLPTMNGIVLAYFTKQLKEDVGLTIAQYGLLTGYANGLMNAIAAVLVGWAVDRFELRRTWVIAAGCLLLGGMMVLEGMSHNFTQILMAVIFASIGGSIRATLTVSLVSDLLPPHQVSIGEAVVFSGAAVAEIAAGNLAYATNHYGVSWRLVPISMGIVMFSLGLVIPLLIREPPKGRYTPASKAAGAGQRFRVWPALRYLMAMRTFWLLTLAVGVRGMSTHVIIAFVPPYLQRAFPNHLALDSAYATAVGVSATASAVVIGIICERRFLRTPGISLLTSVIGGLLGGACFMLTLWSPKLLGTGGTGYAFMLALMGLGALLAIGSAGPVLAMVALMLPPDSKSFGLSAFHCVQSVIDPSASVVLGVVLQVLQRGVASKPAAAAAATGAGLERGLAVARALIGIAIAFSLLVSSALFTAAIRGVRPDFELCRGSSHSVGDDADGEGEGNEGDGGLGDKAKARVGLPRRRLVGFIFGVLVLGAAVLGILALSLIACYAPGLFGSGGATPEVVSTGDVGR
ncbi:hypothetical protein WJX81_005683 [Elliptochloris bilobata]|uniref:Major facilitator superfamily (MFS) profile domain-containing protein n=1 Tax=Elliptochloris bilobata TaxID=381761 RepID=A0AAW1RIE3_9CHLO